MMSESGLEKRTNRTTLSSRSCALSQRCRIVTQVFTRASSNHGSAALSMMARTRKWLS